MQKRHALKRKKNETFMPKKLNVNKIDFLLIYMQNFVKGVISTTAVGVRLEERWGSGKLQHFLEFFFRVMEDRNYEF